MSECTAVIAGNKMVPANVEKSRLVAITALDIGKTFAEKEVAAVPFGYLAFTVLQTVKPIQPMRSGAACGLERMAGGAWIFGHCHRSLPLNIQAVPRDPLKYEPLKPQA